MELSPNVAMHHLANKMSFHALPYNIARHAQYSMLLHA